MYANVETGCQ
ncbi:hypothetical protein KGM_200707A, partial [Danaus plexippus plexippus]